MVRLFSLPVPPTVRSPVLDTSVLVFTTVRLLPFTTPSEVPTEIESYELFPEEKLEEVPLVMRRSSARDVPIPKASPARTSRGNKVRRVRRPRCMAASGRVKFRGKLVEIKEIIVLGFNKLKMAGPPIERIFLTSN
jgi:hypothetical protein